MTKQSCKTCGWWDIAAACDAAGRVRADRVAACRWRPIVRPESLNHLPYFTVPTRHMLGSRGTGCPCWKERE